MTILSNIPDTPCDPDDRGIRWGFASDGDYYLSSFGSNWNLNKGSAHTVIKTLHFTPAPTPPRKIIGFKAGTEFRKVDQQPGTWVVESERGYPVVLPCELAHDVLNALPPSITHFTTQEDGDCL